MAGDATWQASYDRSPGGQAGYQQMMTVANTASMAQAGAIINEWGRRR